MARIFALLMLVAAATAAAAGERFSILQPDQMNADQKKLLEALLGGPRGAALALSPLKANTCRQASASLWVCQVFTLAARLVPNRSQHDDGRDRKLYR